MNTKIHKHIRGSSLRIIASQKHIEGGKKNFAYGNECCVGMGCYEISHGVVNHAGDEQRIVFRRGMTATASILLSIAYLFTLLLLLLLLSILCFFFFLKETAAKHHVAQPMACSNCITTPNFT
ncbi:hypothetical protein, unlikely [Trypanosoma brucei gambiense DAL972]|uniref:Uncharacterized protein n=1 Tax=Trypanosoma brucei gambiense (strain MHOM/CI/86/DAL972) TaxID=679716 RepID=D0A187_TRYB9|nr:hypothetical protein, unlikely [Trypanosoma brucei gambiense DAL972]CBH15029.1 hypothetical protein, unlikely [Trypanosoma brucei gambiense DAL972]|eukprot:XP_011777295.1 hypothetical protein, unlikely [Trypanosoma brucei gambiense DAL972]